MRCYMGKRKIVCISFLFFLMFIFMKWLFHTHLNPSDDNFTHVDLCPACYGSNLCPKFFHGDVSLIGSSKLKYFQILNRKNVYYGKMLKERIILKKLAHNWELEAADALLCKLAELDDTCHPGDAVKLLINKANKFASKDFFKHIISFFNSSTDIARCPSERLLSHIFDKISMEHSDFGDFELIRNERIAEMMYSLLINPEAVIIQAFPQSEGWPFPAFRGSCGRVIVVEYVGRSLAYFENSHWRQRLDLAYQLLQMSQLLTENPLGFSLHMTDVTMDNFAVKPDGTLMLVDVENIVIVDRWKTRKERKHHWNEQHTSKGEACKDCLNFSFEDLCSYDLSDHNYYAICKGLLIPGAYYSSKGLLHNIPSDIDARTNLSTLLHECADPTVKSGRFIVIAKLLQVMKSLL